MMKCPPLARPEADDWLVTQPFSPERRPITPVTTVKSPNSLLKPSDFKQRMDGQAVIPPSFNHTPTLPQRADTEHSIYQSDGLGLLPPSAFVEVIRHTEITSPQCADSDTGSVISSSCDRGEGRDNTLADIQRFVISSIFNPERNHCLYLALNEEGYDVSVRFLRIDICISHDIRSQDLALHPTKIA